MQPNMYWLRNSSFACAYIWATVSSFEILNIRPPVSVEILSRVYLPFGPGQFSATRSEYTAISARCAASVAPSSVSLLP
jgi:hypothetical protein